MSEEVKEETKVEEEVVLEEKTEEDEFDSAFSDATADLPQVPVEDKTDTDSEETKEDPTDGTTQDDPLSTESIKPKVETAEEKSQREKELEERLAKAEQKMSTWEGRISAANERAKKAEEEAERLRKAKESKKEDLPSTDEDAAIKEFIEEFPDLHKPIVALVRRELIPIVSRLIDERVGKIEPQVTSIKQKIESDTTAAHFSAIENAHPNWKKDIVESGALDKWISTKTTYIRDALLKVKAEGDTQEVIDMFNQYKEETGKVSKEKLKTDETKTSKAQDLLAVPSSPTTPSTKSKAKDKDDFDGSWDEALKSDS